MQLQSDIMKRSQRKRIGTTMRVLVDYIDGDVAFCRGAGDAPDIDNAVQLPAGKTIRPGDFVDVTVVKTFRGDLLAEKRRKGGR